MTEDRKIMNVIDHYCYYHHYYYYYDHTSSTERDTKSLCSPFPDLTNPGTHLCGFSSLLQRFVTAGGFYMQQFGTPPIRTATKRTFTLTNYYHPLYNSYDNNNNNDYNNNTNSIKCCIIL